ncbi:hypothetical protein GCM10011609_76910 [Lentzea pudingi]|uniref:Uncharacterized protein n=1 Tax=Lentzea pudingi TaxID=1789439 RepID=A0ABQ2INW7_9PSEU|nr:hypothetical protein [Lentzea pudingi]GGN23826.1 hypothetical protein GCM10011609_76910 [Lentzea pudingi]
MTTSFQPVTVDEDFDVNSGSSYSYTRTVHLGPYTVQMRVQRSIRPHDSWAVAEILSADLTWTALAHTHSDRWFEHTTEPYGVNAKDELNEIADDLIRRVIAIIPSNTTVPQQTLDVIGALLSHTYGSTGERVITADDMRWAKEHGGPFRLLQRQDGSVLLTKAHRYDCPLLATAGAQVCDGLCVPVPPTAVPGGSTP